MSYTPTEWKTGDVITADKLNNMESGIVGAGKEFFVIHATGVADAQNTKTQPTLDKTFAEISAAYQSGLTPVINATQIINGQPIGEMIVPFISHVDIQGETFAFSSTIMSDRGSAIYLSSVTITFTAELRVSSYVEKVLKWEELG